MARAWAGSKAWSMKPRAIGLNHIAICYPDRETWLKQLEHLRDDDRCHFTDAEFLFMQAAFNDARVLSALIPVGQEEPEQLVGAHHTVAGPR